MHVFSMRARSLRHRNNCVLFGHSGGKLVAHVSHETVCGAALARVREMPGTHVPRGTDGPPQPPRAPATARTLRPFLRAGRMRLRHDRPARRPAVPRPGRHRHRRAVAHDPPWRRGRRRPDRRRLRPADPPSRAVPAHPRAGSRHRAGAGRALRLGPGVPPGRAAAGAALPRDPRARAATGRAQHPRLAIPAHRHACLWAGIASRGC